KNATPLCEPFSGGCLFLGVPFEEHAGKDDGWPRDGWNFDATARPGEAQAAGGEDEARESRFEADALGGHLIDRNAVPETWTAGMRRGGQKRAFRVMATIDIRVRSAGNHREFVAKSLNELEVFR